MAEVPSDAAVRAWAESLSDGALRCRTTPSRHQPVETTVEEDQMDVPGYGRRRRVFVQNYRCRQDCGCTWTQIVDATTGEQFSLRIKYPSNPPYLAPHGFGRVTGAQLNIVRLVRFERFGRRAA